jgi:hypothetical protein
MIWYVTRKQDGALASIHEDHMAGYNDESLSSDSTEIVVFLAAAQPAPTQPSPREWLERLSPEKQGAIAAAGAGNSTILLWLLKAAGSKSIDVTAQETISGVAALVGAGVLTTADQTILLTP